LKPMSHWLIGIVTTMLFAILFIGCEGNPTIATVGKDKITANDLKSEILRRVGTPDAAAQMPLESRMEMLNNLITKRLQLLDAYDKKIDQRPDIARELNDFKLRNAQQLLYDNEVRNKIIKESEVKDFYKHQDVEIRASHILVALSKTASAAEKSTAKVRADSIYNAVIKPNADFAAIARLTTQDMSSRDGDIGYFGWGRMVDEFQDVVWKMKPGEISKPFLTNYGWHIVKVTDRRKVDVKPLEEMRDQIEQTLMQIHRQEMMNQAQKFLEQVMKDYHFATNMTNIALIVSKSLPSSSQQEDPFSTLSLAERDLPLVTFQPGKANWGTITEKPYYKAGKVTVSALIDKFAVAGRPGAVSDTGALRAFATQLAQEWMISDYVVTKGLTKEKSVVETSSKSIELDLISRDENEQVTDRASHPTDAELRDYLFKNQIRFRTQSTSDLIEVLFTNKTAAEKYAAKATKRGSISLAEAARLTKRVATPDGKTYVRGKLENVSPTMFGKIGAYASQAPVGKIIGPLPDGQNFSVFQVVAKNPPRDMTLDDGKDQIAAAYRQDKIVELRKDWLDQLRKKYPVSIREEGVKSLFGGIKPVDKSKQSTTPMNPNQVPPLGGNPHRGMKMNPNGPRPINPHTGH